MSEEVKTIKIFCGTLLLLAICLQGAWAGTLNVALVFDGHDQKYTNLINEVKDELASLLGDYDEINFPKNLTFYGDWKKDRISAALNTALAGKQADVVMGIGPAASHILCSFSELKKPAFATQIINAKMQFADLQKMPKNNLSYINIRANMLNHLQRFQEVQSFSRLGFVVSDYIQQAIPELAQSLQKQGKEHGFAVQIVKAREAMRQSSRVLREVDAVYLAPLNDLTDAEIQQLLRQFKANKLPSMNMIGSGMVEKGAMLSLAEDVNSNKVARRLALNLQRLLFDENPAEFSTEFTISERLHINMQTARQIGVYPTWEQMTDAFIFNPDPQNVDRELSLVQVIESAVIRNLKLAAKQQEIEADLHGIDRARAILRPQIFLFGRETVIDSDRAESIMSPAKFTTQLGADLMQVIYSEQANANIDIQKLMLAAKKDEERALILDVMKEAALAYLSVLQARTLETIQKDNLEVTRANLEIARFREQVGISGPAEVYRWEIRMASSRQAVIDSSVMRKKAELALNQVLHASQEEEFTTADCDIFARVFTLDQKDLAPYIDNSHAYRVFRDFLVYDSFALSPEIQQLENSLKAQNRAWVSAKRRYSKPTVALQGNVTRAVKEAGIGEPKPPMTGPFANMLKYPDKNDWYVGVNISIPLHEGGDRRAAAKQANAKIRRLEHNLGFLMQRLELNTRASLEDARASYSSIGLANTRAEFAAKSLDLVQSAYSRGAVNILDLIDAQNSSFTAKEASANAMFNFFSDLVKVCRAVGTFDFILEQESHSQWLERLQHYFKENAVNAVIKRRRNAEKPKLQTDNKTNILYKEN